MSYSWFENIFVIQTQYVPDEDFHMTQLNDDN